MIKPDISRDRITAYMRQITESHTPAAGHPPTPQSAWTLPGETIALLTWLIREYRPSSVLEFGAGLSSVAMARALGESGGSRLTSIDHDVRYCMEQWAIVETERSVDARLVRGDLKLRLRAEGLFYTYTGVRRSIADRGPYDLVLIDAPPYDYGRDAALHLAWPHLSRGALILLDDYRRSREQHTVRRWLTRYRGLTALCLDPTFGRGVAILRSDSQTLSHWWPRAYLSSFYALYALKGHRGQ